MQSLALFYLQIAKAIKIRGHKWEINRGESYSKFINAENILRHLKWGRSMRTMSSKLDLEVEISVIGWNGGNHFDEYGWQSIGGQKEPSAASKSIKI